MGGGAQVGRSFAGWQNDAPACAGGWKGGEARERRAGGMFRAARQRREVETLHPARRFAVLLLVTEYGGFNEVQETPPF